MLNLPETDLRILPPAAKYLKKIKDKRLKKLYSDTIKAILRDPFIGDEKSGDLKGIWSQHVQYKGIYCILPLIYM